MSRYNTVLYNWTEVTNRLLHDKQLLAHFLRFSAGMYKQSFSDAALIYQQKVDIHFRFRVAVASAVSARSMRSPCALLRPF